MPKGMESLNPGNYFFVAALVFSSKKSFRIKVRNNRRWQQFSCYFFNPKEKDTDNYYITANSKAVIKLISTIIGSNKNPLDPFGCEVLALIIITAFTLYV
ncbi:MAG: hypothetical protein JWQ09_484 [Segetibacter sp.]|nr:hypothetical protein [Segetibacter sp.]